MKPVSTKKLLFANLKSRIWLFLLILIAGFFIYPVNVLLTFQQYRASRSTGDSFALILDIHDIFLCQQTGNRIFLTIIIVVAAFAAAAAEFNYLHKVEAVDFWNAAAVSRRKMTLVSWCAGALLVIVPFAITYVTGAAIAAGIGAINGAWFGMALVRGLYDILLFLTAYTFTSLGQMISGRTFIGVCMGAFFSVIAPVFVALYMWLADVFFPHVPDTGITYSMVGQMSPILFSAVVMTLGRAFKLLAYLCGGMILLLIAAEKRPAESAGSAFSFRFLYPLVKISVTIAGALGFAMLGTSLFVGSSFSKPWYFFFLLIGGILIPVILDLVFYMDWRGVKKGLKLDLICLPVIVVVSILFMTDPLHVDTYVPADNEVKSVGISGGAYMDWSLQGSSDAAVEDDPQEKFQSENEKFIHLTGTKARAAAKEPVDVYTQDTYVVTDTAELAEKQDLAAAQGELYFPESSDEDTSSIWVNVCWKLKSGKTVRREYAMTPAEYRELLTAATEDADYRKASYLAGRFNIKEGTKVEVYSYPDYLTQTVSTPVNGAARYTLLECIQEDSEGMSLADYLNSECIGTVDFSNETIQYERGSGDIVYGTLNIYPEYTKTLAFLETLGIEFNKEFDYSTIRRISYYPVGNYQGDDAMITLNPDQYELFFASIKPVASTAAAESFLPESYEAYVDLKDGSSVNLTFTLRK